jgi:F-type H+-transporting ATPase subunit b
LLAQIINFLVILLILRAVYPRILKMLDTRAERIAKALEDARVAEQARASAERDAQKLLDERRAEGAKLVDEARARAEVQAKAVIEEAQREANALKAKAMTEGEAAKAAALGDVRSDVINLAMAAAERLIGQSLDEGKSHAIVSDFFSKSSAELKGLGDKVEVVSALPLTDDEKAKVKAATGASDVTYKVDPALLGGLLVRAGDKVVDGSVRSGLSALAASLR